VTSLHLWNPWSFLQPFMVSSVTGAKLNPQHMPARTSSTQPVACIVSRGARSRGGGGQGCSAITELPILAYVGLAWVGCAWGIERRSKWGSDLSREECYASGGDKRYDAIMAGEIAPYAFTGPPDECTSEGCMHDYWGAKCRYSPLLPLLQHLR